ncbi:MAG: tRNA dihydrouridine synthase DusB [Endomicrobium sp.]|jgi:tRNA-dihydrouridine synthase B|nr:tRNA dihydrouridine synthase DusB [Endomicrobium sp.]
MQKLCVGNIKLNNNIILAPMAGITNISLRCLAKNGGAGLVYTEMISAKALIHNSEKTKEIIKISPHERPISVQIFGCDAYDMSEAAKIVRDIGADIVDINFGCPMKKIFKSGGGAKLLDNEKLIFKILKSVVKSIDIPVTIKIRIGLLTGQNIAPEIINIAQDCGIKMVVVHARSVLQKHMGAPDLKSFADACENAKIPVVANGGIINEETAHNFFKIPNCSGIMIGRGAIANYSIFRRLEKFFSNGEKTPSPLKEEKMQWLKEHIQHLILHYGERKGLVKIKRIIHYYVKNLPSASKIKASFYKASKLSDVFELIDYI